MKGVVVIDSNLLVLLVVGSASRSYISQHKRLKGVYSAEDFDLLNLMIAEFSDIVLLPHVLAETSNLAGQIGSPARAKVRGALRKLIESCAELPVQSVHGARRAEFHHLGLTDSVILHLCTMQMQGISPTLLTADRPLADRAAALGYSVIDYRQEFLSG
jgi:hypothetical protein